MKTPILNPMSSRVALGLCVALSLPGVLQAQQPKPATPVTASAAGTVTAEAADMNASGPKAGPAPVGKAAGPTQLTVDREVFSYETAGRRDPYKSLMTTNELRPLLSDLRLTAIAYDPDGSNSVAILREIATKVQHRVKVGQQLGRMRVASIRPKQVVFTIEEFGLNRQETLQVSSDSTKARTP